MERVLTKLALFLLFDIVSQKSCALITDEAEAWKFVEEYSVRASEINRNQTQLAWEYQTNITEYNENRMTEGKKFYKPFWEEVSANASQFDFENFQNATLKKTMKDLANRGWAVLSDAKYDEFCADGPNLSQRWILSFYKSMRWSDPSACNLKLRVIKLSAKLQTIYSEGKISKSSSNTTYALEPELTEMLASSRDYNELLWIWKNWRDVTGKQMRNKYLRFIELQNEAARANGYEDAGAAWRSGYDAEGYDFRGDLEKIYTQLEPFYKQLHKYVRHKLVEKYGKDKFPSTGHIPAHLLGNMWAQTWGNIEDLTLPYEGVKPVNATPAIQKMTIRDMFMKSDEFFTSLGLLPVTQEFWDRSMLEKPADGREVVCHASAWDFNDGKDFRIKQCTRRNMEDFITVHHEMGHIQYYLQYKDLLYPFRTGANPGFHEAVGDVLALSVSTPSHLKAVGLIDSYETNNESDINYLISIALDKIVFLPFGKLMDDYRWALFAGEITKDNLNAEWWKRRCKYQGLSPPVERTEADFDAGAKYHIPANVPYVRYLVSYIIQFQFHKALCAAANQTGPLHTCDIYRSEEAGKKLGNMLRLGASQDWQTALEAVTGSRNMSAEPMVEYFEPLLNWLREYNSKIPDQEGWSDDCPTSLPKADTAEDGSCDKKEPNGSVSTSQNAFLGLLMMMVISILLY